MDILKEDSLVFLDFTDVDDTEKNRVLSSLRCSNSNVKLPWIITKNVPSKPKSYRRQTETKKQLVNVTQPMPAPPIQNYLTNPTYGNQSQQYSAVYPVPKFATISSSTYPVTYPVIPLPPVYNSYPPHLSPINNTSQIVNPVIYPHDGIPMAVNVNPNSVIQYPSNLNFPSVCSAINSIESNAPENLVVANNNTELAIDNLPSEIALKTEENTYKEIKKPQSVWKPPNGMLQEKIGCLATNVAYGVPTNQPFPANKPKEIKQNSSESQILTHNEASIESNVSAICQTTVSAESVSTMGKSWASLFNSSKNSANSNISTVVNSQNIVNISKSDIESAIKNPKSASFIDPVCYRMAEFLLSHTIDGKTISLQPRGLVNRSNYCYINSILQALLACPPLYNLLSGLAKNITSNEMVKSTPVINSMCKFVMEFEHLPAGQRVGRRTDKNQKKDQSTLINCDTPLEPSWIYKMLNGMRSDWFLIEGRQEDAEEFLGCLLNGLNDEMQELVKLIDHEEENEVVGKEKNIVQDDDWQVMGPKNKGSITRKTKFAKTPISQIFGGLLSSKIHRQGDESSNNIQPFFTLQLNIEKVKSVNEALEALVIKNQLEGVTSSKTNEEVEAWQQVNIEELPVVLILHLKCFDYKLESCTKIVKALEFPIDLKIDSKLLSSKIGSPKERQYKLFAVVYHDGKEASKGHYITDAFHVGYNSWIRYDDASVKAIAEDQVLTPQGSRVPYLLFYRRNDTIRSK